MLYTEFLKRTGALEDRESYEQYQVIEKIYSDCESVTQEEAYRIWKNTYGREKKRREVLQRERLELLINRDEYGMSDCSSRVSIHQELYSLFWAAYHNKDGSRCRLASEGRCYRDVYGITWVLRYEGKYPNGNTVYRLYALVRGVLLDAKFTN